jgi:hypothetical protein
MSRFASDERISRAYVHDSSFQPKSAILTNTTASYTTAEQTKLSGIASNATVGATWGVNLSSIPTVITNTTASYTTAEQTKLSGIASNATVGATWGVNLSSIPTVITNTTASYTSTIDERLIFSDFGVQNNSTNYYLLATITTSGNSAYIGGFLKLDIVGQGRTLYTLLCNAFLNGTPNAFDNTVCSLDVFAPLGVKDSDTFVLVVNFSSRTAKIYYKHPANSYNMKYITGMQKYTNSATVSLTKDSTGVSVLPTSDFTITTTITI